MSILVYVYLSVCGLQQLHLDFIPLCLALTHSLSRSISPPSSLSPSHTHPTHILNPSDAPVTDGVVYVISPSGKEVATILVDGPEISGLVVR